jgi:hypothetical protein
MRILIENTPPIPPTQTASDIAMIDWDAVVARASEVLSPDQLASLEVFRSDQAYQRALRAARQDREVAAGHASPSSPPNP